jgi:hypothetical protein
MNPPFRFHCSPIRSPRKLKYARVANPLIAPNFPSLGTPDRPTLFSIRRETRDQPCRTGKASRLPVPPTRSDEGGRFVTVEVGVKPKRKGNTPPRAATQARHTNGPPTVKQGCQRLPSANPVSDQVQGNSDVTNIVTEKNSSMNQAVLANFKVSGDHREAPPHDGDDTRPRMNML